MIQALFKYFLRGLLVVTPVAVTAWVVYLVFTTIDAWVNVGPLLDRRIPGVGFALTILAITLIGLLASLYATRWLFRGLDTVLTRLPFVKLLYTSLKDLIEAFVGDRKRFDVPVLVKLDESGDGLAIIGFMTRSDLAALGLPDRVAVYFPQSYNFAGNVIIVPRDRVRALDVEATAAMAFIVSGGVSGPGSGVESSALSSPSIPALEPPRKPPADRGR